MPLPSSLNLFTISRSHSPPSFYVTNTHFKPPLRLSNKLSFRPFTKTSSFHPLKPHFSSSITNLIHGRRSNSWVRVTAAFEQDDAVRDYGQNGSLINFDVFLSSVEFLCLASSAFVAIGYVVNYGSSALGKPVFRWTGGGVMVWQWLVLVIGAVAGCVIRRRQWWRICNVEFSLSGNRGVVNLLERVEKLEEDLRSSATIIRVLSRQLEKLGIRFRVTRKALKEPIAQTAELAQKNSEATRALAAQEDLLEKELGEIQKVLLAMQEQQQKQLELILTIAKSAKLGEGKKEPIQTQSSADASVDGVPHFELGEIDKA